MRLWTLHPRHLDAQGLVALWREALLAKAVLQGRTRGYRHHPQLERFRGHPSPVAALDTYRAGILEEARRRGYRFDARKVGPRRTVVRIRATYGQLRYEWSHLLQKLRARSPGAYRLARRTHAHPHRLFRMGPGPIAPWEVGAGAGFARKNATE